MATSPFLTGRYSAIDPAPAVVAEESELACASDGTVQATGPVDESDDCLATLTVPARARPLDRFVRLASRVLRAPVSTVTLIEPDRQRFVAEVGLPSPIAARGESPLTHSVCKHVVAHDGALVISDARNHDLLRGNPAIAALGIGSYLGVPVRDHRGSAIGSLCVIDHAPREWTVGDEAMLIDLAQAVSTELDSQRVNDALAEATRAYRSLLDATTELVCAADGDGVVTYVNQAWCDAFGFTKSAAIGRRAVDLVAPEHRAQFVDVARRLQRGERVEALELVAIGADGRRVICRGSGTALMVAGADGVPRCIGTRAVYRDVTRERELETEGARLTATLEESEARFRRLLDVVPDGILKHVDGRVHFANPAMARLAGVADPAQLVGQSVLSLIPPEDVPGAIARSQAGVHADTPRLVHERLQRRDGGTLHCEVVSAPITVRGKAGMLAVVRDVSARLAQEVALREREERLALVYNHVSDLLVLMRVERDAAGYVAGFRCESVNDTLVGVTGRDRDFYAGKTLQEIIDPKQLPFVGARYEEAVRTGAKQRFEYLATGERGTTIFETILTPVWDAHGLCTHILGASRDVTEQRALERQLAELSEHDELTGLLNRRGFTRRVEQSLRRASRSRRHDALLYVDLDKFKPINDTYGHAAGDDALRAISEVLRGCIRASDFAGRLGGDEFAIYASGFESTDDASVLVERLHLALGEHNRKATADGRPYSLAFSIGVALVERTDSYDSLAGRADAALYERKHARG